MSAQVSIPPCPRCDEKNSWSQGGPNAAGRRKRFCRTCKHAWVVGAPHPHLGIYTGPPCPRCDGKKVYKRGVRKGQQQYYCRTCKKLWIPGARFHRGHSITVLCKTCSKHMQANSRRTSYCSRACAQVFHTRRLAALAVSERGERLRAAIAARRSSQARDRRGEEPLVLCNLCGKTFQPERDRRVYCSRVCAN